MLKVLVIPCDIQLPDCFSILEVESTCLCFVRICTQVIPFQSYQYIYDNRPSSTIVNKARTNTPQLNDRKRHTNKENNCLVCDTGDKEDIYHIAQHTKKR